MAKKVKKKLNIKRTIILILIIYLFVCTITYLVKKPIKNIIISGNNLVSDVTIIEAAGIKNYPSMLKLNIKKMKSNIKNNPLISDVEIRRNLKYQLKINVKELKVICLDKNNNKLLLENNSKVNNNNEYLGIPILNNYTPEEILKKFLNGMGKLDYGTLSGISEIEYSPSYSADGNTMDEERFLLKMNDGNLVYININKLSSLKYYQKIYASLGDKKGILHLDSGEYLEVQ